MKTVPDDDRYRLPIQIALSWMLRSSQAVLPISGPSRLSHLEENVAAVAVELSNAEFAALDREGPAQWVAPIRTGRDLPAPRSAATNHA